MNYFRLENNGFKFFIKNSKTGIESQQFDLDFDISNIIELTYKDTVPTAIKKILKNLDALTQDDKIIWGRDFFGFFRGIVIKECRFSNFKIILEEYGLAEYENYDINSPENFDQFYRISLIKDGVLDKKAEYVINLLPDNEELINLLDTIERKLLQEGN